MISLLALPTDLLLITLDTLEAEKSSHSRKALLQLALTSKQVHAVVKPVLYRDVVIDNEQALPAFALHIFTDSQAANMVQSFSARGYDDDDGEAEDQTLQQYTEARQKEIKFWETPRDQREYPFVQQRGWPAIPNLDDVLAGVIDVIIEDKDEAQRWKKGVRKLNNTEAVVMMVLSCLPRLQRLTLEHCPLSDNPYFDQIVQCANDATREHRPLQELTEATFEGADNKYPNSPSVFASFFRLPAMQRVKGTELGENEQSEMTQKISSLKAGSSTVTEIELGMRCKLWNGDLQHIITVPKELHKFKYRIGNTWAWYPARTDDIINALTQQRENLQDITLLHGFYEWVEDFGDDESFMGPVTLSSFTNLKRLELAMPFLFGGAAVQFGEGETTNSAIENLDATQLHQTEKRLVEALPNSIETLCFAELGEHWAARRLDYALTYLLERRDESFPRLQKLETSFGKKQALIIAKALESSLSLAKKKGLEVVFEALRLDSSYESIPLGRLDLFEVLRTGEVPKMEDDEEIGPEADEAAEQ